MVGNKEMLDGANLHQMHHLLVCVVCSPPVQECILSQKATGSLSPDVTCTASFKTVRHWKCFEMLKVKAHSSLRLGNGGCFGIDYRSVNRFELHMEPILDPAGARCRWQLAQLGRSLAPLISVTLLASCWQHHLIHRQISKGTNQHLQFLVRWHAAEDQCHRDACGYTMNHYDTLTVAAVALASVVKEKKVVCFWKR